MTHEEKLQIDLLWYQAMEDCVKEDSVRYAFAALVAAAERKAIEPIVYGLCISDNNAQEIVNAIRKRNAKT